MSGIIGFSAQHVASVKKLKEEYAKVAAQYNAANQPWLNKPRSKPIHQQGVDYANRQSYSAVYLYPAPPPYFTNVGAFFFSALGTVSERQRDAARTIPREGIRAGEIVAYRIWEVMGEDLLSVSMRTLWVPSETMAGDIDAGNGIYCFKDVKSAEDLCHDFSIISFNSHVSGSIEIWGDIIEHEHGYRAQFAAIKSLDGFCSSGFGAVSLDRLREKYLDAPANDL